MRSDFQATKIKRAKKSLDKKLAVVKNMRKEDREGTKIKLSWWQKLKNQIFG